MLVGVMVGLLCLVVVCCVLVVVGLSLLVSCCDICVEVGFMFCVNVCSLIYWLVPDCLLLCCWLWLPGCASLVDSCSLRLCFALLSCFGFGLVRLLLT